MLLGRPRIGQDVDWSKITKTTVATVTTLPPPVRTRLGVNEIKQIMPHMASLDSIVLQAPGKFTTCKFHSYLKNILSSW